MNWINHKLDWRLAILLLFVLFSILYGLFLLLRPKQTQTQTLQPTPTPSQSSQNPNLLLATPTMIPKSLFVSNKFSIQHPKEWLVEKSQSQDGERVIFFTENVRENKFFPNLTISIVKDPQIPIEKILIPFLAAGFTQDSYIINNKLFIRVSGTFPSKTTKNGNLPQQETGYFLKDSDNIYIIKYRYEGIAKNALLEKIFLQVVDTFTFL